jgi:hypothetical protein
MSEFLTVLVLACFILCTLPGWQEKLLALLDAKAKSIRARSDAECERIRKERED